MIISRAPLRVSITGGISDIPDYYNGSYGSVLSFAIDKYVYVILHESFDGRWKIRYSQRENCESIDEIRHPIIRECLKYVGIETPLEIVSLADIPGRTGLGSSSTFTVALLSALYKYKGIDAGKDKIAEDACHIEIDVLGKPIGKQDQYAAAIGHLNQLKFKPDNIYQYEVHLSLYDAVEKHFVLFYVGTRSSGSHSILSGTKKNLEQLRPMIDELRNQADDGYNYLMSGNVRKLGDVVKNSWAIKKHTGDVSNQKIDNLISKGIELGAYSGKLLGEGSSGFLLFFVENDEARQNLIEKMPLKHIEFKIDKEGVTCL